MNKKLYLVFLLTVIVGGFFLFFWTRPMRTLVVVPGTSMNTKNNGLPAGVPAQPSSAALPGEKLYRNEALKYGFAYPEKLTVNPCQDGSCLFLSDDSVSVQILGANVFKPTPETGLKKSDLFCMASGPGVNIVCTTTKVAAFTNANGTKGYAVTRNKRKNKEAATTETVYVFPLTQEVKGTDGRSQAGVMFQVENLNKANPVAAKALIESVFVY